jgi:hypothetical protein
MPVDPALLTRIYPIAWSALGFIFVYYVVVALVLRWRPRRISVPRYEPPQGVSPAATAYLLERGRCERAYAAAIVSLAARGCISIQQQNVSFVLKKNRGSHTSLPPEESLILEALFPDNLDTYEFDPALNSRLLGAYGQFADKLKSIAQPDFILAHSGLWLFGVTGCIVAVCLVLVSVPLFPGSSSPLSVSFACVWTFFGGSCLVAALRVWPAAHSGLWLFGFACCIVAVLLVLGSVPVIPGSASLLPVAFVSLWVLLGGSCLVAALRVWPAVLRKFASYRPWNARPRRPLDITDVNPFLLTVSALMGFAFLASLTSTRFALLLAASVLLSVLSRHWLYAPTQTGRKVLAELADYREFLSRANASRLDRENRPGETPQELEKCSGYAVALGVERSWGDQFSTDLLEILQYENAYTPRFPIGAGSIGDSNPYDRITSLRLGTRKR